ncbi:hypothetical protein E8L90_29630 [Brevibacillus antibioticus]|uniref:Uncharacterized protein n=1 Tax=Brevibacillus antibioticus TaxID=2570228 RepID=A0A4U2XYC2_9BACL|nr:hypothetical protein [Brevibacillus antibioticus]TKI52918.1 hypothetical protein E8L90_29630 [Brevibacillus antibioticus]
MVVFQIEPDTLYSGIVIDSGYNVDGALGLGYVVEVQAATGTFAKIGDKVFIPKHLAFYPKPQIDLKPIQETIDVIVGF